MAGENENVNSVELTAPSRAQLDLIQQLEKELELGNIHFPFSNAPLTRENAGLLIERMLEVKRQHESGETPLVKQVPFNQALWGMVYKLCWRAQERKTKRRLATELQFFELVANEYELAVAAQRFTKEQLAKGASQ